MTTIFVPTRFKERVAVLPEITYIATEETLGECYSIPVWGYLMEMRHGVDVRELFGIRNCYDSFLNEDKTAALFVAPLSKAEFEVFTSQVKVEVSATAEFAVDNIARSLLQVVEFLKPIALSQNCEVTLHINTENAFEPYDDENLHVVLSSSPPGRTENQRLIMLDTVMVSTKSGGAKCPGPAEGRGHAVLFDEEFTIGQIVGSTLYLFLPTGKEWPAEYAHRRDNPFLIALSTVWQDYLLLQREPLEPEVEVTSYEDFAAYAFKETFAALLNEAQQQALKQLQQRAESLRHELALVYSQMKIAVTVLEALEQEPTHLDLPPLWEQLSTHPSIERITVLNETTFHYHTTPVHIEDEAGRLRDVGSFTIEVGDFNVYIWSNRITHPKRISHPHITSTQNSICFGNISSEVAKLCAENRKVEVALLCLRWLTEGYEPTLTYHRVEEWPLIPKEVVNG